jgi:hypothetical protein
MIVVAVLVFGGGTIAFAATAVEEVGWSRGKVRAAAGIIGALLFVLTIGFAFTPGWFR